MMLAPLTPRMMRAIRLSAGQEYMKPWKDDPQWCAGMIHPGLSYGVLDDGEVVAGYGILPMGAGRGWLWAMFDREIGPRRFLRAVRQGERLLDGFMGSFYRVEATVKVGYTEGVRFADLMGFEREGTLRKYDGVHDYHMYARVT